MQIKRLKILYHKTKIKQIKYGNNVWFFLHFVVFTNIIGCVLYDIKMFMEKIFSCIWQFVSKNKKRLIYGTFIFFIGQICFFSFGGFWIENYVLADGEQTQNDIIQEKSTERYSKFSFLHKVVYVVIYPILIVAGKLVDNSFVYWEIFWFDAVLWQLWNIVKNLANFSLWFIFVYKIFKFLLKWQKPWDVKKIIVSSLIAWIGIQASRFLMAALIDVSTILTYWVGWLPISVLGSKNGIYDPKNLDYNPYVLKTLVSADAKDIDTVDTYLTNTEVWEDQPWVFYISECETFSYKVASGDVRELILAPKMIYYKSLSWYESADSNRCHYYGQIYYFSSLYSNGDLDLVSFVWSDNKFSSQENRLDWQNEYKKKLTNIKQEINSNSWTSEVVNLIRNGNILEVWDAHITWWVLWSLWWGKYWDNQEWWLDEHNKWTWSWWKTSRLQDVLNGHSYVGVFTALYSSLMNSWRGIISSDAWTFAALLNVAISLWYVLAIWIPLIVVALVFMIRIWVLWMAIVLSPFIVLAEAFEDIWKKVFKWKFLEYLSLKNLIPIIFSPAIICFAISMSTVLVTVIMWFNNVEIVTGGSEVLWGLIKLNIGWLSLPLMKLIVSVLWVAITWFIVRAAIETTKIWESKIISSLKWLATNALWSIPIVPVVWKWVDWKPKTEFVWTNAAFGDRWIIPSLSNKIKREFENNDNEFIQDFIDPDRVKWRQDDAYKNAVIGLQTVPQNWTNVEIDVPSENWNSTYKYNFNQISANKKDGIIQAINGISDASKRALFGSSQQTIMFNNWEKDVTYKFVEQDSAWRDVYKYELQWS